MKKYKRIRLSRQRTEYTQKQVADYLGIHQSTYSHYEDGSVNIPLDNFIELGKLFNVSLDYLAELSNVRERR